ncbi:MAG: ApeP family dehydratase [Panacagrimonas sp.]
MLIPGRQYRAADTVPHGGDMRLIDEIEDYGPDWIRVGISIGPRSLFAGAGGVPAWVGLEYMAQTICAYGGIEQLQQGRTPRIGLLIGARRYESAVVEFAIGTRLRVEARLLIRTAEDMVVFECEIHAGQERLAWAEVKAFRPEDIEVFLR